MILLSTPLDTIVYIYTIMVLYMVLCMILVLFYEYGWLGTIKQGLEGPVEGRRGGGAHHSESQPTREPTHISFLHHQSITINHIIKFSLVSFSGSFFSRGFFTRSIIYMND